MLPSCESVLSSLTCSKQLLLKESFTLKHIKCVYIEISVMWLDVSLFSLFAWKVSRSMLCQYHSRTLLVHLIEKTNSGTLHFLAMFYFLCIVHGALSQWYHYQQIVNRHFGSYRKPFTKVKISFKININMTKMA